MVMLTRWRSLWTARVSNPLLAAEFRVPAVQGDGTNACQFLHVHGARVAIAHKKIHA